jgi:hypothetical protein
MNRDPTPNVRFNSATRHANANVLAVAVTRANPLLPGNCPLTKEKVHHIAHKQASKQLHIWSGESQDKQVARTAWHFRCHFCSEEDHCDAIHTRSTLTTFHATMCP